MPNLRKIVKNSLINTKPRLMDGPIDNTGRGFEDYQKSRNGPLDNSNPAISVETYISNGPIAKDGENVEEIPNPTNPTRAAFTLSNYRDHNQGMDKRTDWRIREAREEIRTKLRPLLETIRQIGKQRIPATRQQNWSAGMEKRATGEAGERRDIGPAPPYGLRFPYGVPVEPRQTAARQDAEWMGHPPRSGYDVAPEGGPEPFGKFRQIIPGGIMQAVRTYSKFTDKAEQDD